MSRKRVALDAGLLSIERGIGSAIAQVLRCFAKSELPFDLYVYVDGRERSELRSAGRRMTYRRLPSVPYPVWEHVALPLACARDRIDLLHSPGNTGPAILPPGTRRITTVHDLIFFAPPDIVPPPQTLNQKLQHRYYRTVTPWAAKRSDLVLTDSHFSEREIVARLGIAAANVRVVALGATHVETPEAGDPPAFAPYLFALGATDPRKNNERLIRAFASARERDPGVGSLVMCGLTESDAATLRACAAACGCAEDVRLLGFVSAQERTRLYRGAYAFAYVSLYEGFGLPVLEAMTLGAPVIASSTTSVGEVAGEAALLVDPTDTEAIAAAIVRVACDADLRTDLSQRGTLRAAEFTWENTAAQTLRAYESALA